MHKFHWVIDKENIVEHVKPTAELDIPLLSPTKLNTTPFAQISSVIPSPAAEIGFIGVVVHCAPSKYAGRSQTRCPEVTITDDQQHQVLLTLWDDFDEIKGTELEKKMKDPKAIPTILGRNIGSSTYQGLTLQTRFNSTICIGSPYPQVATLLTWAKANPHMLLRRDVGRFDMLPSTTMTTSEEHSVISIAELATTPSVGVFHVEAEMTLSNDLQQVCVLECRAAGKRSVQKISGSSTAPSAKRKPHYGITTALISGNLAEKVLSMTANDIFHTTCIKQQLLPIKDAQDMLEDKLFHVQLRKTTWRRANMVQSSLTLVSYREVEAISPLSVDERSNKRAKSVSQYISKIQRPTTEGESSILVLFCSSKPSPSSVLLVTALLVYLNTSICIKPCNIGI